MCQVGTTGFSFPRENLGVLPLTAEHNLLPMFVQWGDTKDRWHVNTTGHSLLVALSRALWSLRSFVIWKFWHVWMALGKQLDYKQRLQHFEYYQEVIEIWCW